MSRLAGAFFTALFVAACACPPAPATPPSAPAEGSAAAQGAAPAEGAAVAEPGAPAQGPVGGEKAASADGTAPVAGAGAAPRGVSAAGGPVAGPPPGARCLAEKGCPETPREIPPCKGRMAARPLKEIADRAASLAGRPVVVGALLRTGTAGCTRMGCAPGTCCNRCSAFLVLADPNADAARATGATIRLDDASDPARFACSGDESAVCCPYRPGVSVVARGTLAVEGSRLALRDVELCAP